VKQVAVFLVQRAPARWAVRVCATVGKVGAVIAVLLVVTEVVAMVGVAAVVARVAIVHRYVVGIGDERAQ
jgi:hypothetical protein